MLGSLRAALAKFGLPGPRLVEEPEGAIPDLYGDEDEIDEPTTGGGAAVRTLHVEDDAVVDEPTGCHPRFTLNVGGRTHAGMKRRTNEDAMLILDEETLYVVADGMGGHAGGEVASQLAVDAIASSFLEKDDVPCVLTNVPLRGAELVQSFAAANEAVRSIASREPLLREMGTTVVALRFCPRKGRAYIGHVGDSRCYRLRDGDLQRLTRDHTLGELGATGREAHRLSRAVGANGIVEADLAVVQPQEDDVFLLCSDGLTKSLPEDDIADVLRRERDPEVAAQVLVVRANEAGARDNVTAVVVRVAPSA
jgi:protein phosphatase